MTQEPDKFTMIRNLLFYGLGVEDVRVKTGASYYLIALATSDDDRFSGHCRIAKRYQAEVLARRQAKRAAA